MITSDYHLHSNFSSDSNSTMESMIEGAISLGLKRICFTDHMDIDYPERDGLTFVFDLDHYCNALEKLREKYKSKIEILTGIELGLQPHLSEQLNQLIKKFPFDFIIGSTHVIDQSDPYYPDYWLDKTVEEGIGRYFKSITDNCNAFNGFHVYGHLDYIIRYAPKKEGSLAEYSYKDYGDLLDEALKTIIAMDKGIEVNTSGYKYNLGFAHPHSDILIRYRELGGELITIGSDAHKPEHLAFDFSRAKEMLRNTGFKYYAEFKSGAPVYKKL